MLREGGTDAGTRLGCPRPPRGLRPPPPVRRAREGAATSTQNGGYETRAARPPARHMAGPRPGAQTPAQPGQPLTHRPVAQDGDLPGLGLRHLGGLLSPGPTTSTAAAAAPPAQTIGGECAGRTRHTERGGGRGCLSLARLWLAQPPGTDGAGPPPPQHTHVTARGRVSAASRRRLPARNARRGVRVGGTFYFKGRKRRRPKAPGKVTTETRCVMTLPPTSAAF